MATYYYIYTKAISASDAIVSMTLKQQKVVNFLAHDHDVTFTQKYPYYNQPQLFQKF